MEINRFKIITRQRKSFDVLGYSPLLKKANRVAIFCSNKCPGEIILKCQDWANGMIPSDTVIISGFHTPVEKEVLRILLRSNHPIVICPARSLVKMRLPPLWKNAIESEILCLASDFPPKITRATKETAKQRNHFVVNLSNSILIPYAANGSKTEALAKTLLDKETPVYIFDSSYTQNLKKLGCIMIS